MIHHDQQSFEDMAFFSHSPSLADAINAGELYTREGQAGSALREALAPFHPASVSSVSPGAVRADAQWRNAFSSECKDRRYYEIVEKTLHPEFDYNYFVVKDRDGKTAVTLPFFFLDQDLLTGTNGAAKSIVDSIRKVWPKFLYMKTLMVGCAAGEAHLPQPAVFENEAVAAQIAEAALAEARRHRAGLIVFKEFPAKYRQKLRGVRQKGFIHLPSLPMASLNIAYKSFDDYLAKALSASARKDLRRKFKAARNAPIEMSVLSDITPYIDEVYPLYLQVYNRSHLHFEKLTEEYLCELGQVMPERVRYFTWRLDGKAIAFNLCMVHGESIYDQYIGLDYDVALDLHLYHYTFRDIVTWAIANDYRWYKSNGLNYDPKFHLRMTLDPLDLYVRHRSGFANAIMKAVLPWLEPTQYDKNLKRFPNYNELWDS